MARAVLSAAIVGGGLSLAAHNAEACGACFTQPSTPTVVSGHRMVVSISKTQTVLWDQIQYSGDPADFAWVLPIKPGARIEASTSAFFEVLEAATARQITGPYVNCGGGGGFGCGSLAAAAEDGGGDFANDGGVTVVHHGTVGPYETVTLSASTPGALNDWLSTHGYGVDPSTQPTIDAYVADGFDFIAIRLLPDKGVGAMTPVRVVQDGASPSLPLRMVGIGTGADVPIVLYVIGEGRWETQNFPAANIVPEILAWDFEKGRSNYDLVRKDALAAEGGRSWLTAFASVGTFISPLTVNANGNPYADDGYGDTFAQVYVDQALTNGEIQKKCSLPVPFSSGTVVNPCPLGVAWDSPECAEVPTGDVDARTLGCEGADDISTALTGMNIGSVWLTRLEADLPHSALDVDLLLQAAAKQEHVERDLVATIAVHPEKACGSTTLVFPRLHRPDEPGKTNPLESVFALALGAVGLGFLGRRWQLARSRS